MLGLVAVERLERAGEDHATEVPEHCRDHRASYDGAAAADLRITMTSACVTDSDGYDEGHHVVVDGSNIATEGRSLPSLAQLNEAVLSLHGGASRTR